jgi:hypothetical protein
MQLWLGFSGFATQNPDPQQQQQQQEEQGLSRGRGVEMPSKQQQKQMLLAASLPTSYSASFLAAAAKYDDSSSSSSSSEPRLPKPLGFKTPGSCLLNLKELMITNLSRADGPWEPSVVLGDELLAGVVLGCPALKTLEVCVCVWGGGGGHEVCGWWWWGRGKGGT